MTAYFPNATLALAAAPRLLKACHMALEQEEGWKEACENALALPKITVPKKS